MVTSEIGRGEMASVLQWPPRCVSCVIDALRGGGVLTVVPVCWMGLSGGLDYRTAIIWDCVLEHGHGIGAVRCDDGALRGETTHKAKAWVVRGWTRTAVTLLDWQWASFE